MLIFEMFSKRIFIILNSMLLINFMWRIEQGSTSESEKDPRDNEIERLKNGLKRAQEKITLMNETVKTPPINRYAEVKFYIEKFESNFGTYFEPDMCYVNNQRTPEAKNREIRRQKCDYILKKVTHAHQVDHLLERLNINYTSRLHFCEKIADAYEIINEKLESGQESPKNGSLFDDSEMDQFVHILMRSFTGFHPKYEEFDEFVQVPKSVYLDWMKKDAQVAVLKTLHDKEMESLEKRIDKAKAEIEQFY